MTSTCKDVDKKNPITLLVKIGIDIDTMENNMEVRQIKKKKKSQQNYHMIQQGHFGYLSEGSEIAVVKRYLHRRVHYSIIYNSRDTETT